MKWLKDESLDDGDGELEPEELVTDAIAELRAATEQLTKVLALLETENGNPVVGAEKAAAKT